MGAGLTQIPGLTEAIRQKAAEKAQQVRAASVQQKAAEVLAKLPPSLQEKVAPALPALVESVGKIDTDRFKQNGMKLFTLFRQQFKQQQQAAVSRVPAPQSSVDVGTGSARRSLLR